MNKLDSSNFISLQKNIPNIKLDIRYYSEYNFLGCRVDGYEAPKALLTKQAYEKLSQANKQFNDLGFGIIVYDAYRPQRAVDHFVRWANNVSDIKTKGIFYPDVDKKDLFKLDYVAQKSSHSRGSSIDLTLYNLKTNEPLDMGSSFDYFSNISHSDNIEGLNDKQIENRKLLKQVMLNNGFKSLYSEWWHFTLIDEPYKDTYFDFPII